MSRDDTLVEDPSVHSMVRELTSTGSWESIPAPVAAFEHLGALFGQVLPLGDQDTFPHFFPKESSRSRSRKPQHFGRE